MAAIEHEMWCWCQWKISERTIPHAMRTLNITNTLPVWKAESTQHTAKDHHKWASSRICWRNILIQKTESMYASLMKVILNMLLLKIENQNINTFKANLMLCGVQTKRNSKKKKEIKLKRGGFEPPHLTIRECNIKWATSCGVQLLQINIRNSENHWPSFMNSKEDFCQFFRILFPHLLGRQWL